MRKSKKTAKKMQEGQFQQVNSLLAIINAEQDGEVILHTAFYVNLLETELGIDNQRKAIFDLVGRVIACYQQDVQTKFSVYDCVWALLRIIEHGVLTVSDMLKYLDVEFWDLVLEQAASDRNLYSS